MEPSSARITENLIYIFNPLTVITKLSKATSQRLLNWSTFLGQYPYTIQHIAGSTNLWGDILSRWVTIPTARGVFTVLAPLPEVPILEDSHPDNNNNSLLSVEAIRHTQQQYLSIAGDEDSAGFHQNSFWTMDGNSLSDDLEI